MPIISGGGGGLPATWAVPTSGGIAVTPTGHSGNYVEIQDDAGHTIIQAQAGVVGSEHIGQVTINSGGSDTLIEGDNGQGTTATIAHDKFAIGNGFQLQGYPDAGSGAFLYLVAGNLLFQSANAATASGNLNAGDFSLWLDQTNGASKLMVKAKSANGTVVTGSVNLA